MRNEEMRDTSHENGNEENEMRDTSHIFENSKKK